MSMNALSMRSNPFDLDNNRAYEHWRDEKLEHYPQKAEELIVR